MKLSEIEIVLKTKVIVTQHSNPSMIEVSLGDYDIIEELGSNVCIALYKIGLDKREALCKLALRIKGTILRNSTTGVEYPMPMDINQDL